MGSHGVHTFEHLRRWLLLPMLPMIQALSMALDIYSRRLEKAITATGGAIGDERIAGR
ncbi:MAG: hypothetical protein MZV63_05975 [Marinilabiliales bacterium]|nr:hypothetical protein [Marinilabiliales bacterium]